METLQSQSVIAAASLKSIKIDLRTILRWAREKVSLEDSKFGEVPTDTKILAIQFKKGDGKGGWFNIVRIRCETDNAHLLPKDLKSGAPAENIYLYQPGNKEVGWLKEIHRKE